MFITKARKFHKDVDGRHVAYDYYRLTKARLTPDGKKRNDHLLCLGPLEGLTKAERNELADMLTVMIEEGQSVMSFNPVLYEKAMEFYLKYRESRPVEEFDPVLRAEAERKETERRRDLVTIRLSSLVQKQARTIGPEAVCRSTLCLLKVREFLSSRGWNREQVDLALMQIIARAIYPFSELKTVRYLQGNSALLEMFKIERRKVTKDALYQSAQRLWEVHREMEDFLHERVRSMFNLEEKILLLDISNTYFEGRMEASKLCFHGRSKEKRNDCKIVVLAAVVNNEGLLVRTMIYEGNRQDVKSDGGIKAHLNLTVLAYWIVSVTKYRLKLKEYPNVRWDEIMRIAQAQVVVTAEMDTEDGQRVTVRQSTEAEEELAKIYSLLEINPNPIGKVKSMVHPKAPPKNPPPENQGVM